MQQGAGIGQLWLFGMLTIPLGLITWHRLGPEFGLGLSAGKVDVRTAYTCLFLLVAMTLTACLLSPRG